MKYLQIEYKTGNLFQYSKEEKEGFEKHVSTKDNVSYRNYHKNVLEGTFVGVELDKDTPIGAQIKVVMHDTNMDDNVIIQLPLYSSKGDIDRNYATSLIRFLPYVEPGQKVKFYSYSLETDNGRNVKGVSLKDVNNERFERLSLSYYDRENEKVVKGDIPAVEKIGEDALGKPRFDASKKEDFLAKVLAENIKRGSSADKKDIAPNVKPKTEENPPKVEPQQNETEEDGLPF